MTHVPRIYPQVMRFPQVVCGGFRVWRLDLVGAHDAHDVLAQAPLIVIRGKALGKATWKREFKLPWREAGPPNHHDNKVDSDQ